MSLFTPFAFMAPQVSAAGPFSPASNPDLLAWYDASDTDTVTVVSNAVSQWDDKSGNGYNATQVTAGLRPAWTINTLNSYNVLTFGNPGSPGERKLSLPSVPYNSNNNVSMYMVGRRLSSKSYSVAAGFYQGSSQYTVNMLFDNADQDYLATYTNTGYDSTLSMVDSTWYILELIGNENSGTTWDVAFYGNGSAEGTVSNISKYTVFGPPSGLIGSDEYGSYLIGDIAEIVLIDNTDSTDNRQKMEGYLAWKWGLEGDLPADHPYKNSPPE